MREVYPISGRGKNPVCEKSRVGDSETTNIAKEHAEKVGVTGKRRAPRKSFA